MSLSGYFTNKKGGDPIFSVEAPKIKFGRGALNEIGDDARALGMTRVAVFTDTKVAQLEPVAKVVESLKVKKLQANSEVNNEEAVYLNLWQRKIEMTGDNIISNNKRDLNRYKWSAQRLNKLLKNKNSKHYLIYEEISNLLNIKQKNKAFHPNALRKTINLGPKIFAFKRISLDKKQTVMCISNLSSKAQSIKVQLKNKKYRELIIGTTVIKNNIILDPFQTIWLSN